MSFTHIATRSTPMVSYMSAFDRDLDFVPTPSFAATRIGSTKPGRPEIEKPPIRPFGVRAGAAGRPRHRPDPIDETVAAINVDAGFCIAQRL